MVDDLDGDGVQDMIFFRINNYVGQNTIDDDIGKLYFSYGLFVRGPDINPAEVVSNSSFRFSWQGVEGVDNYRIYVSEDPSFERGIVYSLYRDQLYRERVVSRNTREILIKDLKPGNTYYYRMRSSVSFQLHNCTNCTSWATLRSPYSNYYSVYVPNIIPDIPNALPVEDRDANSFVARWTESENSSGYLIDVSIDIDSENILSSYSSYNLEDGDIELMKDGSVYSFNVGQLLPDTRYYYRIRGYNNEYTSGYSNIIDIVTLPIPPLALEADNIKNNSFIAKWDAVIGIESYRIEIGNDLLFSNPSIYSAAGDSYSASGLNPGSSYYYRVRSVGINGGLSDPSNVILVVTSGSNASGAPVALPATDVFTEGFVATWSFSGNSSYVVEHSEYSDFRTDVSTIMNADISSKTHSISAKSSNTIYYYRVRLNSAPVNWSNVVSVLTLPVPPMAYNPIVIRENSFIGLCESIENALEYELEVWDVDDMNASLFYSSYDTMIFVGDLSSGGTYNYRVRVRTGSGWSEYSNSLMEIFTLLPGVPVLVPDIFPGEINFVAGWESVRGAGSYVIQVSYDRGFNRLLDGWGMKIINDGVDIIVVGLESGYGYYYRVRSRPIQTTMNLHGVIPLRQYTIPRAPSALTPSEIDGYSFVANWHGNGASDLYLLDVSDSSDFASSSMIYSDLVVYGLSYRIVGLNSLEEYHYRVRSKSGDLVSNYSNIISTETLLAVPEILDGIVVGDSVIIAWLPIDVDGASYELEISLVI